MIRKENCILMMHEKSIQMHFPISTLFAEDSLARAFLLLESEADLKTQEEPCSLKLPESLPLKDLSICFLKMYPACLTTTKAGHFKKSSVHWMNWGTMSHGKCITAKISEFPNQESDCTLSAIIEKKVQGEIFAFPETTASNTVRCIRGSEGDRVYSVDGTSITLTSSAGGFGGKTGLYLIPVISNTKLGYQYAKPGDSIDIAYLGQKQRRGRVGKNEAHTLTTTPSQTYYFIDMNADPKLTEIARCITARQNAGVSKHKGEHSALLVLVGEFNADEFSDIYARLHEFVELDEKENKIALLIIVADTQCFVGFVRRLTPKECWRLQGFSDEQYLKSREAGFSDSQQYKQAGNAVTVNVVEALAKRIKIIDERNKGGLNG